MSTPDAGIHVVKEGETLIGIAIQHGLRVADLKRFNRLFGSSLIFPGQRLAVCPDAGQPGSPLWLASDADVASEWGQDIGFRRRPECARGP